MKVIFKKEDLAYATGVVHHLVIPQTPLPILSNIFVRASGKTATFIASDMESCVKCEVAAEVTEKGETTIPAATFTEIVRELPDASITVGLEDKLVKITCETNHYSLTTMPAEDFPRWPDVEPLLSFELPQKTLKQVINKTLFAVPQKDPRRVLLGAYMDVKDKVLKCVATDGKKLGFVQVKPDRSEGGTTASAIVPQKILAELQKILRDEGSLRVSLGQRQIAFDLGNILYVSNKIEGTYPNYEMVIPKDFAHQITIAKETFIQGIRRAAIISEEKNNSIIIKFRSNEARISAMTFDIGSFEGSVPVGYEGSDFDIAFNYKYLLDVLRVIDTKEAIMKVKSPSAPVIFNEADGQDAVFLVMPIKLADLESRETEESDM
jgi:DNA polymerase-3 subunit beta